MNKMQQAAKNVLVTCMGVKRGENVLVLIDAPQREIGRVFFEQGQEVGAEMQIMEFLARKNNGEEPPAPVAQAMLAADAIIAPTSKSLSHTEARKQANNAGARVASLPGITVDMMARTLLGDYTEISRRSSELAETLNRGERVSITAPGGTNLNLSIVGRTAIADGGDLTAAGAFGNLPAGEAFIAPVEGSADGTLVVDGAMAGVGKVAKPIVMTVKDGKAVDFAGGEDADTLKRLLAGYGDKARNIAELGIGTNDLARLTGLVLEDEKVLGTIHIALGDNHTFGGQVAVPIHLDGMVLSPTVIVDGKTVLAEGKLSSDKSGEF